MTEEVKAVRPRRTTKKKEAFLEDVQVQAPVATIEVEEEKTVGIIAVDNGGDNTKVFSEDMDSPISFKSLKKRGVQRDLEESPTYDAKDTHSFIIDWNGKVYLTNHRTRLASGGGMTGNVASKANDYFILSALIGVALYGYDVNYVVVSIPYDHRHKTKENQKIKERLIGHHTLIIDKEVYEFEIAHVWLAIEAQTANFHLQEEGITTLLEIGSRTVGYATNEYVVNEDGIVIRDQPILEKTGTLARKGVKISEIAEDDDEAYEVYVEDIFSELSGKIDENDKIVAFGGGILIEQIKESLADFYTNITFAKDPLFVQVRGMLEMAKIAYEAEFGENAE